jgi:hypothetical protein
MEGEEPGRLRFAGYSPYLHELRTLLGRGLLPVRAPLPPSQLVSFHYASYNYSVMDRDLPLDLSSDTSGDHVQVRVTSVDSDRVTFILDSVHLASGSSFSSYTFYAASN